MSKRAEAEELASTVPSVPYVAGTWDTSGRAAAFEVVDPVTERVLASVTEADAETVDLAVSGGPSALEDGEWGRLAYLLDSRTCYFADLLDSRT